MSIILMWINLSSFLPFSFNNNRLSAHFPIICQNNWVITAIIAHLLGSSLKAKNSTFYPVYQAFDLTRSPNQGALPLTSFFNFEPFFA